MEENSVKKNEDVEKLKYITYQIHKTFGKKYENYCITRIYHLLNQDDIHFITQQYFKRKDGTIGLADLYLPQINMSIEINEEYHEKQVEADCLRRNDQNIYNKEITDKLKNLGDVIYFELEIKTIEITKETTLQNINKQIDDILSEIRRKIKELKENGKFSEWTSICKTPQKYIKDNNYTISIAQNVRLRTIFDVSELFNKGYKGCQICFFPTRKNSKEEYVWCPQLKILKDDCQNNPFDNEISEDGQYLYEKSKKENDKDSYTKDRKERRIVFAKYKNETGTFMYKYIGIFKYNKKESFEKQVAAWKKEETDKIDLKPYFNS